MSDTPTPLPEGVIEVPFRTVDKRGENHQPPASPVPAAQPEQSGPSQIVPVNADGTPKPQAKQNIQFKRFENGMVFGFSQNPRKPGTYVIHDATGTPYAIALHPAVADLICQAVTGLFLAREQKAREQQEQLDTLTDATAEPATEAVPAPAPETPAQ